MNTVETAISQDVFDVMAFIEGAAYPEEKVTVYTNVAAAVKYKKLADERLERDSHGNDDAEGSNAKRIEELTAAMAEQANLIRESGITFVLKGISPGRISEMSTEALNEEGKVDNEKFDTKVIAATVIGIENSKGVRDPRSEFSEDDIRKFRSMLKENEFAKIIDAVVKVNFDAAVFDEAVDAGFPERGTDLAE